MLQYKNMRALNTPTLILTLIGTLLQWLEFASFGFLTNIVTRLYFPTSSHTAVMIGGFCFLLTSYLSQPIGAIIFGNIGDKQGRKGALSLAIFIMGIASLTICFLPIYDEIGLLAPCLLLLSRIAQGIAIGGEFSGACVFLMEHASKKYCYSASALPAMAIGIGLLLGGTYADAVSHSTLLNWGWRIPFLLSAISCLLVAYLRFSVTESPSFLRAKAAQRLQHTPVFSVFHQYKNRLMAGILLSAFIIIYLGVCNVYYFFFLTHHAEIPYHLAISITVFSNILLIILFPLMAYFADVIGSQTLIFMGLLGAAITAPMLFMLASLQSFFILAFVHTFFAIFTASAIAPLFGILTRLFPTPLRYTGFSLAWTIAMALFGTTCHSISEGLFHQLNLAYAPALYASVSALLILLMIIFPKNKPYGFSRYETT